MTPDDYRRHLHELLFTCGMNERYHHILEWRLGAIDKGIRILVFLLAVAGLILALPLDIHHGWGFGIAIVALAAAGILNILPAGDWEKFRGELRRTWTDIRNDAGAEQRKFEQLKKDKIPESMTERLCELWEKADSCSAMEPMEWGKLLKTCFADELEREWGEGIRTPEQAEIERTRRLHAWEEIKSASALAGEAVAAGAQRE